MKYYLVDKLDNINTSVDLSDDIGISGAKTYFIGTKKIEEKEFNKLWRVMTKDQYDLQHEVITFGPRMGHDDTIDALAYACKYANPPIGISEDKEKKRYFKNIPKPKSWVIA